MCGCVNDNSRFVLLPLTGRGDAGTGVMRVRRGCGEPVVGDGEIWVGGVDTRVCVGEGDVCFLCCNERGGGDMCVRTNSGDGCRNDIVGD